VGEVNSTIACALVASKKNVPVIHVEAGLRSYDRTMPEEINRVLTDQISDLLFITEQGAYGNLGKEGVGAEKIHFVGNVMIDTLKKHKQCAVPAKETLGQYYEDYCHTNGGYGLVTLHRPSNVDYSRVLKPILETLNFISQSLPLVFPVHPRTKRMISDFGLRHLLETPQIHQLTPLGYLQMLGLISQARVVLTDSGGIQEETTALGVPCITLRENTERPITVSQGTNTIVGVDPQRILSAYSEVMSTGGKTGCIPEKWDGKAAERIAAITLDWLDNKMGEGQVTRRNVSAL